MLRGWKTQLCLYGGEDHPDSEVTVYKTYRLKDIRLILNKTRKKEMGAGLPKRRLSPVFTYLLAELIEVYFRDYAPKGVVLEQIIVKDTKNYGL